MKSEIEVYLKFWNFEEDPEEVTELLGLTPEKTGRKGSLNSSGTGAHVANFWQIYSGLDNSEQLARHLDSLKDRIEPQLGAVKEFSTKCPPVLQCVVYSYDGDRPAMSFSNEFVQWLAELGGEIDIDLYVLQE